MENASKALLIAGAVLLVIAIIAIGMGIFGRARGTVDQAKGQIDNMSIQMYNKQFERYEGTGKSIEEIKDLLSVVLSNNEKATENEFKVSFYTYRCRDSSSNGKFGKDINGNSNSINTRIPLTKTLAETTYNTRITSVQDRVLNESYLEETWECIPKYDVRFEYYETGMIDKIYVYIWHE